MQTRSNAPVYLFGVQIPKNVEEAYEFDRINGNTLWAEATKKEMDQLWEYGTFKDIGHKDKVRKPEGYQMIRCHLIFSAKHDGRRKARFVAGGHLTKMIAKEMTYSSVVTLRGIRMVLFLAELNNLQTFAADVGNAYLEAYTSEKYVS